MKNQNGISARLNPYVRIKNATSGITLIALVVTIIVLLILAGVSIATLTGDNGILTRASGAKETQRGTEVNEIVLLTANENHIASYSGDLKKNKEQVVNELFADGKLTEEEKNKLLGENGETEVDKITIGSIEVDFSKLIIEEITPLPEENIPSATFNKYLTNPGCHVNYWEHIADDCWTNCEPTVLTWEELKNSENGTKYGYNATAITDISIERQAFAGCHGLINIVIPDSVTSIDAADIFSNCINLKKVVIPESVTSLGSWTFNKCESLTSIGPKGSGASLEIPDNVTTLKYGLFQNCIGLTNVVIPDSVTNIEREIFSNCTGLNSVVLPEGIYEIPGFQNCTSLTSIGPKGSGASVEIPDSVISLRAFDGCTGLTSVVIPNTVIQIEQRTFKDCVNLQSVTFEQNSQLTDIINNAFENCTSLTSFVIPENLDYIHIAMFKGCTNLNSIVIHDGVMEIGSKVFENCTSLTTINYTGTPEQWEKISGISNIPDSVTINYNYGE